MRGDAWSSNRAVPVRLQSFFTNAAIFYTLDGSDPSFASTEYTRPFTLESTAMLRAISYRSDFLESSSSPAIDVQIIPDTVLTNLTPGGDVSSRTSPLSLLMDASKVVTARFGQSVRFQSVPGAWDGNGFALSFTGRVGMTFELQASSNFVDWTSVAPLLNETGRVTYVHGEAVNVPLLFYRVLGP